MYLSDLGSNPLIIDDGNASKYVDQWRQEGYSFGMTPRDYAAAPFGSANKPARDLSMGEVLKRSQFADAIKRADENKTTPDDWRIALAPWIENQQSWGYCWGFGACKAVEIAYAMSGYNVPHLNPFPTAFRIKQGRNQGGWAQEYLEGVDKFGIVEHSLWNGNEASMAKWERGEIKANGELHKVTASLELPTNDFAALVTSLTHPKVPRPVTLGLNWWGHLVCGVRAVVIEPGKFGIKIVNSWGENWGEGGCAILTEQKATAAEQIRIERAKPRTVAA